MKNTLFLFLLISIFESICFAQEQANTQPPCPVFAVQEPGVIPKPNEKIRFYVVFSDKNFDASDLKFNWSVSAGKIIGGQGTSSIFVTQKEAITVTVHLQGLALNCADAASGTISYDPPPKPNSKEYLKISFREETEKITKFADEMENDPAAVALIIKIFPRKLSKKNAYLNLQRVLTQLENQKIDKERINFVMTYGKQEKTILWLIPAGATLPEFKGEFLSVKSLAKKLNTEKSVNRKL